MMIITLLPLQINGQTSKTFIKNVQGALDSMAEALGVFRFREYRVDLYFKEHILRVPLTTEDGLKKLLFPAGLLPRRRYPLAVYLCAVSIYSAGGLSMRAVSLLIRRMFGLDKFSHSTISRVQKKLLLLLASLPPHKADIIDTSSLLEHLRELLKDILRDPFSQTERLALHFFQAYQVLLL